MGGWEYCGLWALCPRCQLEQLAQHAPLKAPIAESAPLGRLRPGSDSGCHRSKSSVLCEAPGLVWVAGTALNLGRAKKSTPPPRPRFIPSLPLGPRQGPRSEKHALCSSWPQRCLFQRAFSPGSLQTKPAGRMNRCLSAGCLFPPLPSPSCSALVLPRISRDPRAVPGGEAQTSPCKCMAGHQWF